MNSNFSAIQSFVCELFDGVQEAVITPQLVEIFKLVVTNKRERSQMESCMTDYRVYDNEALRDVITCMENYFDCVIVEVVKNEKKIFQLVLDLWKEFEKILDVIYYHLHRINQIPQEDRLLIKTNIFF